MATYISKWLQAGLWTMESSCLDVIVSYMTECLAREYLERETIPQKISAEHFIGTTRNCFIVGGNDVSSRK